MKQKIVPSIISKNQPGLDADLNRLKGVVRAVHLDIVDGKFAPNHSLDFPFRLRGDFHYQAHLMVKHPEAWVGKNGNKVQEIIFHSEALSAERITLFIKKIKKRKEKVGLALLPETKVSSIRNYLPLLDAVLILTVHPGFYGSSYLPGNLKKIRQLKRINPAIKVIVDGGMSPKTIGKAAQSGADCFVSGSYTTKAENPGERIKILLRALK